MAPLVEIQGDDSKCFKNLYSRIDDIGIYMDIKAAI